MYKILINQVQTKDMYVLWSSFKNSETDPSKISISIDDVTFMLGGTRSSWQQECRNKVQE